MTLSESLLKSAILGTAQQPFQDPERDTTSTTEGQLLLSVARTLLRERASYTPGQSSLPLAVPPPAEATSLCSEDGLRFLRLLLSGQHALALNEWLIEAARMHLHVSADILPRLLLIGQKHPAARSFIVPVLGQRGPWLAREIRDQNWKWVLEEIAYDPDDLMLLGQVGEAELTRQLRNAKLNNLDPLQPDWLEHRFVWSERLMGAFMDACERADLPARTTYSYFVGQTPGPWTNFVYFFPLEMREVVQKRLSETQLLKNHGQKFLDTLQAVYDFRERMITAIRARQE